MHVAIRRKLYWWGALSRESEIDLQDAHTCLCVYLSDHMGDRIILRESEAPKLPIGPRFAWPPAVRQLRSVTNRVPMIDRRRRAMCIVAASGVGWRIVVL
jgi:hypothetical protein